MTTTEIIRTRDQLETKLEELENKVNSGEITREEACEIEVELRVNYINNGAAIRD